MGDRVTINTSHGRIEDPKTEAQKTLSRSPSISTASTKSSSKTIQCSGTSYRTVHKKSDPEKYEAFAYAKRSEDPLVWWAKHAPYFHSPGTMAADLLAFPISNADPERLLATARQVITYQRNSLSADTVDMILQIRSWVLAFGDDWVLERFSPEKLRVCDEEE